MQVAVQIVGTAKTRERVVAEAAAQLVAAVVALERVDVVRADQVLDRFESVAGGIAAVGEASQQLHGHAGR